MDYDRFSKGKSVIALPNTTISSATNTDGAVIDTFGFGSIVVGISVDWTQGSISAITFLESDLSNMSDATPVADSQLLIKKSQLPVGADGVFRVGCISKKRYVKLRITTTGGTVSIAAFAIAELGNALYSPPQVASSVL